MQLSKRRLLTILTSTLGMLGSRPLMAALQPTPRQTEGPFYPRAEDLFEDRDNDLMRIEGAVKQAGGEILHLTGTLRDRSGKPVAGAGVEIWQCDVNGRYLHGGDRSSSVPRDSGFQGFGRTVSDATGAFRFRTIKPVPYPGRTPHIHAKVISPQGEHLLTTQFYVAGDPDNDRDGLYRSLDQDERDRVTMDVAPTSSGDLGATIDVVV